MAVNKYWWIFIPTDESKCRMNFIMFFLRISQLRIIICSQD